MLPSERHSPFAAHEFVANLTLLFSEHPLLERPAVAKAAGFDRVEFWWPFGKDPDPRPGLIDAFVSSVQRSGVQVVAMNLFAGDMQNGERGVLSYPEHTAEFRRSVEIGMEIGERLGIRLFNAPYGHRLPGLPADLQDETAAANVAFAMRSARRIDGTILIEPLSGMPHYPLKTTDDAASLINKIKNESGLDNLGLLFDQYHLAVNGEDLEQAISRHGDLVEHVQIADVPGRGEPGSGSANIQDLINAFIDRDYSGQFALECIPADSTEEALRRLHEEVSGWTVASPSSAAVTASKIRVEQELLTDLPPVRPIEPEAVAERIRASGRLLVVLDDDPTGTQAVTGVPVLTAWSVEDLRWAMRQDSPTFFVLTNTRSLEPDQAAARNRAIVASLVAAARSERRAFTLVSRGDSTLRGHFPLETDVLGHALAEHGEPPVDGVVLCPAYVDAGRLTVDGVHWIRTDQGMLPVGASEFARDAAFGYSNSDLAAYAEEKSGGRWRRSEVLGIGLDDIRLGGERRVSELLQTLRSGRLAVVDAACDDDLRVVALGALAAEESGRRLLYRTGPSFVRARTGQGASLPLSAADLFKEGVAAPHGLVVVGSHVSLTTRQLTALRTMDGIRELTLDVAELLDAGRRDAHIARMANAVLRDLDTADVVIQTTREVVTGGDAATSLAIARQVSAALVEVVRTVTAARVPRFIVAKGGITSSDIATDALRVRRAWVRGTMLPGIVSAWTGVDGNVPGVPYIVFAGNVGNDDALAHVVNVLRAEP
ncbi:four-carbon acid sugar kinase family protein [Actinomadura sp. B10D3]|uniref:four-carbon acid sugar kinase family protein n=1 Tax=Actinomadura sp. B10D3 TaxID=3153557 RepID=UPI00325D4E8F